MVYLTFNYLSTSVYNETIFVQSTVEMINLAAASSETPLIAKSPLHVDSFRKLILVVHSLKVLHKHVRDPLPARPGAVARYDYTYERNGMRNLFMLSEPLIGWRHVEVTKRRRQQDFASRCRHSPMMHGSNSLSYIQQFTLKRH